MKVKIKDSSTDEEITVNLSDAQYHDLDALSRDTLSDSKLDANIDNLEISADMKALLSDIKAVTIAVGEKLINIGRRIIEFAMAIVKKFPNTTFGLILGLLLGMLISTIPVIGFLFGSIVTPLMAALGFLRGIPEDLKDMALDRKIAEATAMFEPLKGDS
jgi:hypothetical protein